YFGALLARGGHDVTFVARGENLAALSARGLVVRLGSETLHLAPVRAVPDPAAAPRPELVLVCVKSYDTPAAAAALRRVVAPDTIVLSLQNGIENEDVLARGLGLPPLLVALTRIGVALVEVDAVAVASGVPVRRRRTERVLEESQSGLPDFQTSMLQDLLRGRRLEHDALGGAVVRAAARAGVAVPVNRVLVALLARLDPAAR